RRGDALAAARRPAPDAVMDTAVSSSSLVSPAPERAPGARTRGERDAVLAALFEALAAAPREHDFFAILRQVEALRQEQPRIGFALRPAQETLRLGQVPELAFAPAALESFDPGAQGAP